MRRSSHRYLAVGILAWGSFMWSPVEVMASCAMPESLEDSIAAAHAVFVGTVTGLSNGNRLAEFAVEEVWKGDLPSQVVVNGGPSLAEMREARAQGLDVGTSVDRSYDHGTRYLVVSYGTEEGTLRDNGCSATQQFSAALEVLRPASAYTPETADLDSPDGGVSGATLAALGLGALAALGLGVLLFRRFTETIPGADG